jgi:hypothetical protein
VYQVFFLCAQVYNFMIFIFFPVVLIAFRILFLFALAQKEYSIYIVLITFHCYTFFSALFARQRKIR